jgi:hypothetical protein
VAAGLVTCGGWLLCRAGVPGRCRRGGGGACGRCHCGPHHEARTGAAAAVRCGAHDSDTPRHTRSQVPARASACYGLSGIVRVVPTVHCLPRSCCNEALCCCMDLSAACTAELMRRRARRQRRVMAACLARRVSRDLAKSCTRSQVRPASLQQHSATVSISIPERMLLSAIAAPLYTNKMSDGCPACCRVAGRARSGRAASPPVADHAARGWDGAADAYARHGAPAVL